MQAEGVEVHDAADASERQALVVAQVAVSMVLLVAGGLLVRSLSAARLLDLGFPIDRLAVSWLDPEMVRYSDEPGRVFWRQLCVGAGMGTATIIERV